jgi:hypothetical protein
MAKSAQAPAIPSAHQCGDPERKSGRQPMIANTVANTNPKLWSEPSRAGAFPSFGSKIAAIVYDRIDTLIKFITYWGCSRARKMP